MFVKMKDQRKTETEGIDELLIEVDHEVLELLYAISGSSKDRKQKVIDSYNKIVARNGEALRRLGEK